MAKAMVPIANTTLATAASSVTFSSITQGYRDIFIVLQHKSGQPVFRFNSDSGSNYSHVGMSGNGTATSSWTGTYTYGYPNSQAFPNGSDGFNATVNILDYSATDKHKTFLARSSNASNGVDATAVRWANTAAITSIQVLNAGGTFSIGDTISVYGVVA